MAQKDKAEHEAIGGARPGVGYRRAHHREDPGLEDLRARKRAMQAANDAAESERHEQRLAEYGKRTAEARKALKKGE